MGREGAGRAGRFEASIKGLFLDDEGCGNGIGAGGSEGAGRFFAMRKARSRIASAINCCDRCDCDCDDADAEVEAEAMASVLRKSVSCGVSGGFIEEKNNKGRK